MDDRVNENDQSGTGVTWRLSQSKGRSVVVLDSPILFELADAHGSILASVSLRTETLEELLRPHISIFVELQLDGSLSLESEFSALSPPPVTTDILELVRQGLAPEMLEDELDVKERLTILRNRLTDALALVDHTLINLDMEQH
jgi:hypothetical protein